jgi:hypothetical protein
MQPIGLNESPTGFYYAHIFTNLFVLLSPTITVGILLRPSPSLARFTFFPERHYIKQIKATLLQEIAAEAR